MSRQQGGGVEERGREAVEVLRFPSIELTDGVGKGTQGPGATLATNACHVTKLTTADAREGLHASKEE